LSSFGAYPPLVVLAGLGVQTAVARGGTGVPAEAATQVAVARDDTAEPAEEPVTVGRAGTALGAQEPAEVPAAAVGLEDNRGSATSVAAAGLAEAADHKDNSVVDKSLFHLVVHACTIQIDIHAITPI
jgi:hypothetical protein